MRNLIVAICLLYFGLNTSVAQNNIATSGSQLLYATNNDVFLYDADTDTSFALPNIASNFDEWAWSSDGNLLAITYFERYEDQTFTAELGVYDFSQMQWGYYEAVDGQILSLKWSHDSTLLAYDVVIDDIANSQLWLLNMNTDSLSLLYETTSGAFPYTTQIRVHEWSPLDDRLFFVITERTAGGGDNALYVIDPHHPINLTFIHIGYYASYEIIWSPTGEWYAINLEQLYFCGDCVGLSDTTEYGDIFLFSTSGERLQLTYDPQMRNSVEWSDDDLIIYGRDETQTVQTVINFEDAIQEGITIYNSRSEVISTQSQVTRLVSNLSPDGHWNQRAQCDYNVEPPSCFILLTNLDDMSTIKIDNIRYRNFNTAIWRPHQ